jgi:hypothetical protein
MKARKRKPRPRNQRVKRQVSCFCAIDAITLRERVLERIYEGGRR